MGEIYEEGLPETTTIYYNDIAILSDENGVPLKVMPREKWVEDIKRITGWSEDDILWELLIGSHSLTKASQLLYDKKIATWELDSSPRKVERFYQSHKGKIARVSHPLSANEKGVVVKEKVIVNDDDNCGDTELCIELEDDAYNFRGELLYRKGEVVCHYPGWIEIKEGDEWVPAESDRFLIAEIPAEGGICNTDKEKCRYADEIEHKIAKDMEVGEKKWYRRGRDYPPYKDGVKMHKIMEEKELFKWFTPEELKKMGYPKKDGYTGSLP